MTLVLDDLRFQYELRRTAQLFFFDRTVAVGTEMPPDGDALVLNTSGGQICAALHRNGETVRHTEALPAETPPADAERQLARVIYRMLRAQTGITPPWGILTGVRPVRLLTQHLHEQPMDAVRGHWLENLLVSEEKFGFACAVAQVESDALAASTPDSVSVYIGIPFCPTRCAYCSFVSHAVEKSAHLMQPYVDSLCREIEVTGSIVRDLGLRLQSIYIGGGTPTALSPAQLRRVMEAADAHFDIAHAREYTVEAGRPDTITAEKLDIIRSLGAGRISINPQTLQQPVLDAIGRRHTVQQTLDAFALADTFGFDAVNMDLIAGLPSDTPDGFRESLDGVLAHSPANITVHTLSVKRAAALTHEAAVKAVGTVSEMVDYSRRTLLDAGYLPYYLYRQSGMLSGLENTGYCRPGTQGLYNIYSMSEAHTVLATGSGAVSKLVARDKKRIHRICNFKHPHEYLSGFDEILARKQEIFNFYRNFAG